MSLTDPIADLLTRIRNAVRAKKKEVNVPSSCLKVEIARILKEEGYIKNYKVIEDNKQGVLNIVLKYTDDNQSVISGLRRVSKARVPDLLQPGIRSPGCWTAWEW